MMAEVIDLTHLQRETRDVESRWNVKERVKKQALHIDPLLAFKPIQIVKNNDFIITKPSELNRIPPQNIVTNVRSKLLNSTDNVVIWNGYGVFNWKALQELSQMHDDRTVAQRVQEEYQWLQQLTEKQHLDIQNYVYGLWHSSRRNSGRESLLCNRLISDEIIEEVLDICNKKSKCLKLGEIFLLLNTQQNVHLQKEIKTVHFVVNVTKRNGSVYVTPSDECGTHWSYVCLDVETHQALYIDSLGWDIPVNLKEELQQVFRTDTETFPGVYLHIEALHDCSSYDQRHIPVHHCSNKCGTFAPLQTCSNICGVVVLAICLLKFNSNLWEQLTTKDQQRRPLPNSVLQAIKQPTAHAHKLRFMLMSCVESKDTSINILETSMSNKEEDKQSRFICKKSQHSFFMSQSRREVKVNLQDIFQKVLGQRDSSKKRKSVPVLLSIKKRNLSGEKTQVYNDSDLANREISGGTVYDPKPDQQEITEKVKPVCVNNRLQRVKRQEHNMSKTSKFESDTDQVETTENSKPVSVNDRIELQGVKRQEYDISKTSKFESDMDQEETTENAKPVSVNNITILQKIKSQEGDISKTSKFEIDTDKEELTKNAEPVENAKPVKNAKPVSVNSIELQKVQRQEGDTSKTRKFDSDTDQQRTTDKVKPIAVYDRTELQRVKRQESDTIKTSKFESDTDKQKTIENAKNGSVNDRIELQRVKKQDCYTNKTNKFESRMIEKLIQVKKHQKRCKMAKTKKKVQSNIKTFFMKTNENVHQHESATNKRNEILHDIKNCVYSMGVTFKGLSRKFFMNIGTKANKNMTRDKVRTDNPLIEENGKKVGLERCNSNSKSVPEVANGGSCPSKFIQETVAYLNNNGPIVKTQKVCDYYQTLKNSSNRVMSSEIVEKLGKYVNIKQIYVNGTGYIVNGNQEQVFSIITELEEMCKTQEHQTYNKTIRNKIENKYCTLLQTLKDPYDRQLIKGFMATLTTPDFMTKIEGKQNKSSYRHCRDSFTFSLNKYKSLEKTTLTVRNDMTNAQQRAFSRRLLERKKKKELKTVFAGRGRLLKSEQFPELASVLEMCFGEISVLVGGGGLESHPRLSDGVLYRACDNNMHMKKAREIIMQLAPENFEISLSSCYNYTENYRAGSHQAKQHHHGKNVNANISLNAPPRTGVGQFVVNLHWTTSNVNLFLDQAAANEEDTFADSKDSKSVVCANVAPVQKVGKSWSRRDYLDHDWNQSRTFAITPMTHLILSTDKTLEVTGSSSVLKVKRTGQAVTLVNISHFEPETAFRTLNELFLLMINPETSEFFRNSVTGDLKRNFLFVVDNGPSTSPSNTIVQMCLVRLFKLLDLDSICQVSFAEYHSKRNPVERVHAEENRALSRHGPFKVETKLLKVGSEEHKAEMEIMLKEVAQCLRTGQFNKKQLIALRGVTEQTSVFNDEDKLKKFVLMTDEQKSLCEEMYTLSKCEVAEELSIVWNIDTSFKGKYNEDYSDIESGGLANKYAFRLVKEHTSFVSLQPVPDYIRYMKTEELHYLDYDCTIKFLEFCDNQALLRDTAVFIPNRILDICWTLFQDPPSYIVVLISLLSWVPAEQVIRYFSAKNDEQKALTEKDKDIISWRQHELYKKTKAELLKVCKNMSLNCSGTKIEIIKRIVEQSENPPTDSLCLDLSEIPNSLSGIASMHVAAVRTVLAQYGLSVFGTKEELVLRLFMHKHQPDLVFKTEKDALLDLVKITENVIMTQCQLDLASVTSERMFPSNKYTTTRKQTLNTEQIAPTVPHPAHLTCDTLQHLFTPLKEFINTNGKVERKKTKSFKSMTSVGSIVKVKWLKEEVIGTGWAPGWYSAVVTAYNEATEQLEVEYLLEKGFKYTMDYTEMLTKGLLEPSEPVLAKLEAYEKMTTVGQEIQIKLENMLGWQDAQVVGAVEEEDIINVKLLNSPYTLHVVEVSPAVGKSLRMRKRTPDCVNSR